MKELNALNAMAQNHKALFKLLAKAKELTRVYDNDGFYSVQAENSVYPKLTLYYDREFCKEQSFDNYLKALEKQQASPYIIFQKNENFISTDRLLKQRGFRAVEEWPSMSISLNNLPKESNGELQIVKVETDVHLQQWLTVVEKVLFNNCLLNKHIFQQLNREENVSLWLGFFNGQPICTILSFVYFNAVGLYMISTLPAFRGKGFAQEITLKALNEASTMGTENGVLQSTRLGINTYRRMGFQEEGKFLIYWKVGKQYL